MDIVPNHLASVLKTMADPNRLRIIICIGRDSRSVSWIVEKTGLSQPLVSHHLRFLKESRLVQTRRKGPFIYYQLTDPGILKFLKDGNELALRLERTRQID